MKQNDELNVQKVFGQLTEFKDRSVRLYRSMDANNTAIYFTDVRDEDRKTAQEYFYLLWFDYGGGDHQIYIKYPGNKYYTEIHGGGFGGGRGDMLISKGQNIWASKYRRNIELRVHNPHLLISIGESLPEFNFMELIGKKITNHFDPWGWNKNKTHESFGVDLIDKHLNNEYLKISEEIRSVQYMVKFVNEPNKFICIDCPQFNFHYNNHVIRMIDNGVVKNLKQVDFARYKDGGTTIINLLDDNDKQHTFFYPTKLGGMGKGKTPLWNKEVLKDATKKESEKIIKLLNLNILEDEKDN